VSLVGQEGNQNRKIRRSGSGNDLKDLVTFYELRTGFVSLRYDQCWGGVLTAGPMDGTTFSTSVPLWTPLATCPFPAHHPILVRDGNQDTTTGGDVRSVFKKPWSQKLRRDGRAT